VIWDCKLPARQYHNLSEEAADQLCELLPGTRVCFGRPEPDTPRGEHDVIGSVVSAEREPHRRVAVRIRFQEHDEAAAAAHAMLLSGECIVGMDATAVAERGKPEDWPEASAEAQKLLVHIYKITAVRSLEVVPEGSRARYTPPLDGPGEPPKQLAT
jgi:hypothetical protein